MKKWLCKMGKVALVMIMVINAVFTFVVMPSRKAYAYTNDNMPSGYRPITSQDVGKTFGVDLETTIYFSTQYPYDPIAYFPSIRLTDNLGREYWVNSVDYQEERPYTYGYAVYNEWQESPSLYYYKELYFFDVVAGEGTWQETNPYYEVHGGYKIDLYYSPSIFTVVWVKDKGVAGGGKIEFSIPFVNVNDGEYGQNNKIPELPIPEYEGRVFLGWYYDVKYKDRAIEGAVIPQKYIVYDGVSSNYVILYGKWSVNYFDTWEDAYRSIWTQEGYDNGFTNGHEIGYQEGYAEAMRSFGSQDGGLYWLTNIATTVGAILALEVFPSISIGLLVFIPFAFGLLFWFLKLLKGGGD